MPVKYVATRIESFQSDAQAREFDVTATISFTEDGELIGMEGDFKNAIGAYSIFPRSSVGDSIQAAVQLGAPYKMEGMNSRSRTFWQNKPPSGAIRGVGQPIPCTVTEQLIDMTARSLGEDPALFRKRHYLDEEAFPYTTHGGLYMDKLSLADCIDLLIDQMSYFELREEQERLRRVGILRGIGIATFVEQTALGPGLYGAAGVPATSVEECKIRLEADGTIRVETGATDQGQGTLTGIRQIIARALSLDLDTIQICSGDSAGVRGGGAWASRGLSLAGEAAVIAAEDLLESAGWTDTDGDGILDGMVFLDNEFDGQLEGVKRSNFEFTIAVSNRSDRIALCELLRENLDQIGIVCNVRPVEFTVLQQMARDHKFHAQFAGWGTGTDPDTSENLWTTKAIDSGRNYVAYSNPEIDKLFQDGKYELDPEKRRKIYQDIHRKLYQDQPYTWLYFRNAYFAFSKTLRGYNFSARGPYNYGPGEGTIFKAPALK